MVMEYLDLYDLFAVYVFGSPTWAIFGLVLIILAITYMGKWSPMLRYTYLLNILFASFYITQQTIWIILLNTSALLWFCFGLWRFIAAYRGQN